MIPLRHLRRHRGHENKFDCLVTVQGYDESGEPSAGDGLSDLRAQYKPAQASDSGPLQVEPDTQDTILILGWYPQIRDMARVILTLPDGATKRAFEIVDCEPGDGQPGTTLLTVAPEK